MTNKKSRMRCHFNGTVPSSVFVLNIFFARSGTLRYRRGTFLTTEYWHFRIQILMEKLVPTRHMPQPEQWNCCLSSSSYSLHSKQKYYKTTPKNELVNIINNRTVINYRYRNARIEQGELPVKKWEYVFLPKTQF
jgi:hypothetical protein